LTSNTKGGTDGIPTGLHIAAFSGLSELARVLIEQGASVSTLDVLGRTPLHWAAFNGHAKLASLLIELGDPNPEDHRGVKPIHLAARKNHVSVVTVLLEAGVLPDTIKTKEDPDCQDWDDSTIGETAILYACKMGHTEMLVAMIPFCTPSVLERLLCEAARFRRTEAALAILSKSDVSANAEYKGATPLYFACRAADMQCVEALIKRGADVRKTTAWDSRLNEGYRIYEKPVETAPIHKLVLSWHEKNDTACQAIFQLLLKEGADLEQLDGKGNTALLIAAGATEREYHRRDILSATRALLAAGADAQKTTRNGDTALLGTFGPNRNPEAVRLLIEHGIDPNHRGSLGRTALQLCLTRVGRVNLGSEENIAPIAKYLVEKGADPGLGDEAKDTALCRAMKNCPKIFPLLLSRCKDAALKRACLFLLSPEDKDTPQGQGWVTKGWHFEEEAFQVRLEALLADPDLPIDTRRDTDGRTLYLCCLDREDMMRVLIDKGANPDAIDNGGNNAVHILARKGAYTRGSIEKNISAGGVDPLGRNGTGDTLLHQASHTFSGNAEAVDYVRWLVSLGIPINAVNSQGESALHASQRRIPYFGKPNNFVCYTVPPPETQPVHFADAMRGFEEAVDFEVRDNGGFTALHRAAVWSGSEVALLARAGADLGALTGDSQNALHLACEARRPNIVLQVLEATASAGVNQRDHLGKTPLHYACASWDPESVAFLLEHGADVSAASDDGSTPLHACAQFTPELGTDGSYGKPGKRLRGSRKPGKRRRGSQKPGKRRRGSREGCARWPHPVRHERFRGPWYRGRDTNDSKMSDKTFFSAVSAVDTVVQMLLRADCAAAVEDKYGFTALDLAIDLGCAELVEVFSKNSSVHYSPKRLRRRRQQRSMRTLMTPMRPRSSMDIVGGSKSARDEVLKSPSRYIELLPHADAATLINEGFQANPLDPVYYELLHTLMEPNHLQIVEQVPRLVNHYSSAASLEEKLDTERKSIMEDPIRDWTHWTPLQMACRQSESNMHTLQLLVEKLHVDVAASSVVVVEGRNYGDPAEFHRDGTALHELAEANDYWQLEGIRYLVRNGGADIDALNHKGESPIHVASRGTWHHSPRTGFWKVVAIGILVDLGADINLLDNNGLSPLNKATQAPDAVRELLRRGADVGAGVRNPLLGAIHNQNLPALQALLDHGVSVDTQDERRNMWEVIGSYVCLDKPSRKSYALACTAFANKHATEVEGTLPLLQALVERGADLYLPLNDEETLVHFLFEFPCDKIADTLLAEPCVSRIDFDQRDQRGRTVLIAACCGSSSLLGRILDRADATMVDDKSMTALHHLLNHEERPDDVILEFINREEVASTLLQKGGAGFSPLHCALRCLRPAVCDLLASKGADLLETDPAGLTALHRVAESYLGTFHIRRTRFPEEEERLRVLREESLGLWKRILAAGVSINAVDQDGNTPLHTFLLSPCFEVRPGFDDADHPEPLDHYDELFPAGCGVDVLAVNNDRESALHLVARRENTQQRSEQEKRSWTQRSGWTRDKELFEAMMGKGVDPLAEDAKGRTA
ncbi:ankyrin repeat domain-containing protein, partial [Candidatus Bathyarchaeota archaeon]|nr:ankyrin repeat domain-containing protein [Candidatus Bathyarchaeota archaeon]